MTESEKREFKRILMNTLSAFVSLCKENNLRYFLAYGSVLGAVRHKGLIPWDDDIDVYMPISDYKHFLALKNHLSIPYRIDDNRDEGYFKPYAKFCDTNTTIIEDEDQTYVYGVSIDVFPLYEGTMEDYQHYRPLFYEYSWKYEMGVRRIFLEDFISAFSQGFRAIAGRFRYLLDYKLRKKMYLQKFMEIEDAVQHCRGDYYISYCGTYKQEIFPKQWFEKMVELPYEYMTCMAPANYNAYLTQLYGNYLLPPPVQQREQGGHPKYYMNLERYMTLQEVHAALQKKKNSKRY